MTVEWIAGTGGLEPLRIEHRLSARGCHETTMLSQSPVGQGRAQTGYDFGSMMKVGAMPEAGE
jgi:hypothetical protein